jgi:multidrug efflux pump
MPFTDIFIRRPVLAAVVSILILLVGARAMLTMPLRQYPEMQNTIITVATSYPGASAELMQGFITHPLEQAIASAEGIDYITSTSIQGQSTISVNIELNYDANKALTEILTKVNQVKYELPKDANDPIITKEVGDSVDALYMSFTSKTLSEPEITDYLSRVVQPILETAPGVAQAEIFGEESLAMRLWLDPARMAGRGVTAEDVSAAILANNYQSAPGQVKGAFTIINTTANTDAKSADQFRKLVVKSKGDVLTRIEDIGTVDLAAQATTTSVTINGLSGVGVGISVTPDGNPLTTVKAVRDLLPGIQRNLPPGMAVTIDYDSTRFIQASINEVGKTLIQALLIVTIVIFMFLGDLRSMAVPVIAIPLSLIGVGTIMTALGFSINLLTLLAMVLAVGLVVDDAIVVLENIYRWIEAGKTPVQAALLGAREIRSAVISMTITLVAVYAPIGFLGGITGILFKEFAFTVAGTVVVSGIVALTLSPMMCSLLLKHTAERKGFARLVDRGFHLTTTIYGRMLRATLNYRWVTGLFIALILFSVGFMFVNVNAELAPLEDEGYAIVITKAPSYANLDYLDAYNPGILKATRSFPETELTFMINGLIGANEGLGILLVKPWEERHRSMQKIIQPLQGALSAAAPGLSTFAVIPPPLPGTPQGLPLQMVVNTTKDYPTLYKLMTEIKAAAQQSGLFIVTDSDLDFDLPDVKITIDRSKASALGLTTQQIGDALALLVGGNYINRFDLQGRAYEVITQVPRNQRLTGDALTHYYVTSRSGQPIPLSTVVSVEQGVEANALTHYNQLNSATFGAVPIPTVTMGQAVKFLEETTARILPTGFSHDYIGDARRLVREGNSLTYAFLFAIVTIFLVLAAQYESWRDPLVVMVTVPLSIAGALLPLFFWLVSFNIYTEVGLVTLIGLISKHGILMVTFARDLQISEGLDRRAAIERAALIRLRPIMMTTAAMIGGLFPLLFASGAGASSRLSIGVVVVAGMAVGTLFTLFVLPAVYTVVGKDHSRSSDRRRAEEIAAVA